MLFPEPDAPYKRGDFSLLRRKAHAVKHLFIVVGKADVFEYDVVTLR